MSKPRSLLLMCSSLAAANVVSFVTLSHNLSAGVYPVDGDSIGIPIAEGIMVSMLIFAFLSASIYIPKTKIYGSVTSVILSGMGAFLSAVYAADWTIPHHFPISFAYGCVAAVCGTQAFSYFKHAQSNMANRAQREQRAP